MSICSQILLMVYGSILSLTEFKQCQQLPVVHVEIHASKVSQTSPWPHPHSDARDFHTGKQMPLSPLTEHGQAPQPQ